MTISGLKRQESHEQPAPTEHNLHSPDHSWHCLPSKDLPQVGQPEQLVQSGQKTRGDAVHRLRGDRIIKDPDPRKQKKKEQRRNFILRRAESSVSWRVESVQWV
jgi:hypothetical protein